MVNLPIRGLVASGIAELATNLHLPSREVIEITHLVPIMIVLGIGWLYGAGMESSHFQASLGKMALRLKVTDLAGNRLSFLRATARHFAKFLSLFSLGIGYLMAGFDEEKQALHDQIAGTRVLYRRNLL